MAWHSGLVAPVWWSGLVVRFGGPVWCGLALRFGSGLERFRLGSGLVGNPVSQPLSAFLAMSAKVLLAALKINLSAFQGEIRMSEGEVG